MKKHVWPYLLAVSLSTDACQPAAESRPELAAAEKPVVPVNAAAAAPENSGAATPASAGPTAPESIDYNEIRINGLPFETTTAVLIKALGKPDQIEVNAVECGGYFENDKGDFYKYGPSLFEVNGQWAALRVVDFSSGKFQLSIGKQVLNRNTTLDDVRRLYPVAASKVSDWRDVGAGKTYQVISIQEPGVDDALKFMFEHNKLVKFEYFTPC